MRRPVVNVPVVRGQELQQCGEGLHISLSESKSGAMPVVHSKSLAMPPWMPRDLEATKWLWNEVTASLQCGDMLHVNEHSCASGLFGMVHDTFMGASKFYAPLFLMHFIWSGRQTLNDYVAFIALIKQLLYYYARSILYAVSMGALCSVSLCGQVWLTGFTYWTCCVSGAITGLAIFLEHPFRRRAVMNSIFNLTFNYLYRYAQHYKLIPQRSDVYETAFFMAVNGVLLHLLHRTRADKKKTPVFWFYIPHAAGEQRSHQENTKNGKLQCPVPHRGSCWKSTLQETAKFSAFAAAYQVIRVLITFRGGRSPANFFRNYFSKNTLASITSIGGYVFLYKSLRCALGLWYRADRSEHSALAGLAAGSAYWFMPNTTILSSAFIAATTMMLDLLPDRLKWASQWPMSEILFVICNAILAHARLHDLHVCPRLFITMYDMASNYRTTQMQNSYIQQLLKFEAKILKE